MKIKTIFYPKWAAIDKQVIVEVINCLDVEEIEIDNPKLTDSLCQEITDNWNTGGIFDENIENPIWDDPDSISEFWELKLINIFN